MDRMPRTEAASIEQVVGSSRTIDGRFVTWLFFLPITQKIKKQVVGMMIDVHINGEFHVMSSAVTCT